jgi:hypothetical protein
VTEQTTIEARPERQPSENGAWRENPQKGALVQTERYPSIPCDFGHHGGGLMPEPCERKANVRVNGISFCEVHGAARL